MSLARTLAVVLGCVVAVSSFAESGVKLSYQDSRYFEQVKDEISIESFLKLNEQQRRTFARLVSGDLVLSNDIAYCFNGDVPAEYVAAFERSIFRSGSKFETPGQRWSSTATDGGGLTLGIPTTITYSFIPDTTNIPAEPSSGNMAGPSNLFAFFDGIYGSTAAWQAEFHQMFAEWGALIGVTYVFQATDDGAAMPESGVTNGAAGSVGVRGDVRIGGYSIDGNGAGTLAFNFFPNGGDMIIDTDNISFYSDLSGDSLNLRNTISHEHGHGLGLPHTCPTNGTKIMEPFINTNFDGPQLDDRIAAQKSYDDGSLGNITTGSATDLGALEATTSNTNNVAIPNSASADFYSFDLAGGRDLTITVSPEGSSYLSGPQQMGGSCDPGSAFDPSLFQNLAVELLDTDGTTVLATASSAGLGANETINFTTGGAGTYFARVFSSGGTEVQPYSLAVDVATQTGPTLSNESGGGTLELADGTAVLSVTVTNTVNPTTFQWFKGVTPLANGGSISGADTDTLTINPIALTDSGSYTLQVTDSAKLVSTSSPIILTVVTALPIAGMAGLLLLASVCAVTGVGLPTQESEDNQLTFP